MKLLYQNFTKLSENKYIHRQSNDILIIKSREKYYKSKPKNYILMQFKGKGNPKYISSIYKNKKRYSTIEYEKQYYNIQYDIPTKTISLIPYVSVKKQSGEK